MNTRRQFLAQTGAALAALTTGTAALYLRESPVARPRVLDYGTFAALVASTFRVRRSDGQVLQVRLENAQALDQRGASFNLTFEGPLEHPLPQGTYAFTHEQLGEFQMFIVPHRPTLSAQPYHAVFNRCA